MPSIINSDDGVVSGTSGLKSTGGNDGLLNIQSNGSTVVAVTGSGISVTGTVSQTGVSTFAAGTVSAPSITFTGDTNTGIFSPAADTIAFTEGGTEAMRIDSSGNVGIGTTSPTTQRLHISAASVGGPSNNPAGIRVTDTDYSVDIQLVNRAGNMLYNVPTSSNYSWQVNNSEVAALSTTGTLGIGGATPATSGTGITFPATQSASSNANTLDDYEQGTFTPTVIGTSSAGTASYTIQVGRYTKVGNRVFIVIYLAYSGGNGTGNLRVTGLPFTSNSTTNNLSTLSVGLSNITLPANSVCWPYVDANSTQIVLSSYAVGGGAATSVSYDAAGDILLSGHYETAD